MASNWLGNPTELGTTEGALNKLGHSSLRPDQEILINALVSERDVLGILATGSGKSACFQVPGLLEERGEPTLVVSPLVALMRDQVWQLNNLGIPAVCLNSYQSDGVQERNMRLIQDGKAPFVYVSAERLADPKFQAATSSVPFGRIVLDEAHCVSMWAHSFRPSYLGVKAFAEHRPHMVRAAFTATASPMVQSDIVRDFGLREPLIHKGNLLRPNLHYKVLPVEGRSLGARTREKDALLIPMIQRAQGEGKIVVYCDSVKHTEELWHRLKEQGITAAYYHGQMDSKPRRNAEESFKNGEIPIMVSTNAFGMGVNLPDICLVVHYSVPTTLMNYVQETGRAGRNGAPADCVLLYAKEDLAFQQRLIIAAPDSDYVRKLRTHLVVNHNAGREKVGNPFTVNWAALYRQMGVRSTDATLTQRFNIAMKILKEYGLLEQLTDNTFVLKAVEPQGPEIQTLASRLELDRRVKLFGLDQMHRYASHSSPGQELLYELMEEDANR